MASLGQKLEEARNRKGISIREASENTKIRGDYLASFEQNNFDVDLPPVYLSGFVKVYARFLGLDPEAVLSELDAILPSGSGKTSSKPMGSLGSSEDSEESESASTTVAGTARKPSPGGSPLFGAKQSGPEGILKPILLVSAGVFAVAVIIVGLVIFLSDPDEPGVPPENSNGSVKERQLANDSQKGQGEVSLRLAAYGPIERLILSDDGAKPPQKKYYERKDLSTGWEETFSIHGSFRCYASSLESIRYIVDDGRELVPKKSGSGYFIWPAAKE